MEGEKPEMVSNNRAKSVKVSSSLRGVVAQILGLRIGRMKVMK